MFKCKIDYIYIFIFFTFSYIIYINYKTNYENYENYDHLKKIENYENYENYDHFKKIENLDFPFKNMIDKTGGNLNIVLITAPFREKSHYEKYFQLRKTGALIIGITSYLQFPGHVLNKYDPSMTKCWMDKLCDEYINKCSAWLYCFRDPYKIFTNKKMPLLELAQSDFTDPDKVKPNLNIPIEYDFIYCCLKDNDKCEEGWNSINRNWILAQKCFEIMCIKHKLKGLVIGRINCKLINDNLKQYLTIIDFQPYGKFHECINKAKFVFIPNIMDASPRILTESLCLNKRVLVNKNIVGGWKYVNNLTGEFFTDEKDIEYSLSKLLNNYDKYQPRSYFMSKYGPKILW